VKKIKPSDLEREGQRLIEAGQMPTLQELLTAIAEVREEYRAKVLEARNQNRTEKP
jgi:cytochrome c-type biogenesis protein CcmE